MPEPDFDQIAARLFDAACHAEDDPATGEHAIAEQLRQVWNARGAADLAATDSPDVLQARDYDNADATYRTIQRALKSLDR